MFDFDNAITEFISKKRKTQKTNAAIAKIKIDYWTKYFGYNESVKAIYGVSVLKKKIIIIIQN